MITLEAPLFAVCSLEGASVAAVALMLEQQAVAAKGVKPPRDATFYPDMAGIIYNFSIARWSTFLKKPMIQLLEKANDSVVLKKPMIQLS